MELNGFDYFLPFKLIYTAWDKRQKYAFKIKVGAYIMLQDLRFPIKSSL